MDAGFFRAQCLGVSSQQLIVTLQALLRSVCNVGESFNLLGRCLLQVGAEDEAKIAFEQTIEDYSEGTTVFHRASCDMCMDNIQGSRYVCKLCVDTDFCEPCHKKYRSSNGVRNCGGHAFLEVPSQDWKHLKPPHVNAEGESIEEWLRRLWNVTVWNPK